MIFKQLYLGCLAHASYLLGSDGLAIVIDPQRDVQQYVDMANENDLKIAYVIETHLHADFVSGHRELAERTGATIVMGKRAQATFPHRAVVDGDTFDVGALHLKFIETPGHTPEGICILVSDTSDPSAPPKLFTGDTLFIGDVGRPDLSGGAGYTSSSMAEMLYDSLRNKILPLEDRTEVYPAHGAGSLCGRNMSKDTWSTLGKQRAENYALREMGKEEFVSMMTANMPEAPKYFGEDVRMNREGAPALGSIPRPRLLDVNEMLEEMRRGALVLDVRPSEVYGPEHIPNSLNIGLDGQFASWAGTLIGLNQPLIVVALDDAGIAEAVMRLARVGFSSVIGALAGGMDAWKRAGQRVATIPQMSVQEFATQAVDKPDVQIVDVRRKPEFDAIAVSNARLLPLNELDTRIGELDPAAMTYVVCGSGYRSSIAASILEGHGFRSLINVDGGMSAYESAGLPNAATIPG